MSLKKSNKASYEKLSLFLRKYGLSQVTSGHLLQPQQNLPGYLPSLHTHIPSLQELWRASVETTHPEIHLKKDYGHHFKFSSFCFFLLLCANKVYQSYLNVVLEKMEVSQGLDELRTLKGKNVSFMKILMQEGDTTLGTSLNITAKRSGCGMDELLMS